MKKNSKQDIDNFLECRTLIVAGASRKEKTFSATVIAHLHHVGYDIISVNKNYLENSAERNEYQTIADIPEGVNNLLVPTSPLHTTKIVKQAIEKGIENIWIQQKSETTDALEMCEDAEINLITNQCILMYTQPEGIHKFHYGLKKIFHTIPV